MKNLAVFASGQGTTFRHLLESQSKNLFSGNIKLLVTNKTGIGAVAIANEFNITHQCIPSKSLTKNQDLLDALKKHSIDFIILTGYLAKIDKPIITEYKNKIINTHPSLLPKFGGKGMYGQRVHQAVIANGEATSGVTIHIVDEDYDSGRVIAQEVVPLTPEETSESLENKIKIIEKNLLVKVLADTL